MREAIVVARRCNRHGRKVLRSIEGPAKCSTKALCCLLSPILFPIVFFFDPETHTHESSGWNVTMMQACLKAPFVCLFNTLCMPCGQFYIRKYIILNGDMSRYKLWQGKHDGPVFLAKYCEGAPCIIEGGTHGENKCPNCCLFAEVTCLGCGVCSPCCAFYVNRDIMKEEHSLGLDPTEARFEKCQGFFGEFLSCAACCSMQLYYFSCCLRNIAEMETAAGTSEELSLPLLHISDEANHIRHSCRTTRRICVYGMTSVKVVAIGCMSSQMVHEHRIQTLSAPKEETMNRSM